MDDDVALLQGKLHQVSSQLENFSACTGQASQQAHQLKPELKSLLLLLNSVNQKLAPGTKIP